MNYEQPGMAEDEVQKKELSWLPSKEMLLGVGAMTVAAAAVYIIGSKLTKRYKEKKARKSLRRKLNEASQMSYVPKLSSSNESIKAGILRDIRGMTKHWQDTTVLSQDAKDSADGPRFLDAISEIFATVDQTEKLIKEYDADVKTWVDQTDAAFSGHKQKLKDATAEQLESPMWKNAFITAINKTKTELEPGLNDMRAMATVRWSTIMENVHGLKQRLTYLDKLIHCTRIRTAWYGYFDNGVKGIRNLLMTNNQKGSVLTLDTNVNLKSYIGEIELTADQRKKIEERLLKRVVFVRIRRGLSRDTETITIEETPSGFLSRRLVIDNLFPRHEEAAMRIINAQAVWTKPASADAAASTAPTELFALHVTSVLRDRLDAKYQLRDVGPIVSEDVQVAVEHILKARIPDLTAVNVILKVPMIGRQQVYRVDLDEHYTTHGDLDFEEKIGGVLP